MPKIEDKYIRFGTNPMDVNDADMPSIYTPVNYVPEQVNVEGNNKVSANFKGIDNEIGNLKLQIFINAIIFG